jgi:hypothetical protein
MRGFRAALLLWAFASPSAAPAVETAEDLLARRLHLEETSRRWKDRYRRMVVRLPGDMRREVETCERKITRHERWTLAFILRPADRRGEGFLVKRAEGQSPMRYVYIPWQKRPRQASSADDVPSFMGDDLDAHDLELLQDIEGWGNEDVRARLREEGADGDVESHVLEMTPRRPDAVYRRFVVWLGKSDLIARRIELYDEGSTPRRRLTQSDVRMVGDIPLPHRIDVESPGTGTHTRIDVVEVQFGTGVCGNHFAPVSLERGRCR